MQVDRQPSPWPSVVMLALLLLLCLVAPSYWQSSIVQNDPAIGIDREIVFSDSQVGAYGADAHYAGDSNLGGRLLNQDGINIGRLTGGVNSDILNLCSPPPIEELIATNAALARVSDELRHADSAGFDWPMIVRAAMSTIREPSANGPTLSGDERLSPGFAAPFEYVGELVAAYSDFGAVWEWASRTAADGVPRFVMACGEQLGEFLALRAPAPAASPSLVRVTGPDDRLAMLPVPQELEKRQPWCVPQALLEELDRLAGQPESAQWASQVRNQLHLLTDREQLDGDDVQIILSDLSDAAQEAVRMANEIDNDQLRVELLRVHWGLARRLDCWGAMHEKRIASRFQSRVAARGPLNPYLKGADDTTTIPAEATALSVDLEKYETNRDPKLGRYIAAQQKSMKASNDAIDRTVADSVEQHYRNANVRVAITAEMLNRLASAERTETQPVNSQIAGTYVHGQSTVHSQSRVLLDPSADEWQLELRAEGVVDSNTLANGGPVRFRSRGTTDFSAKKTIIVNDKGVHFKQSNVDASSSNRLVGVTTDYDWVPLFSSFARDRAIDEYRARQGRVKAQVESRVASEAGETLDQQTREAVAQIQKQTYDRYASELEAFDIKLTPVEMRTTEDRLIARVRVAGDKQLGSHTPRPRALSDSLASAQVHESALTNLAITLGLDGKRFTAPELRNMLREKFPQLATKNPTDARQDTVFQFATEDAVQIHLNDGRLELTISFISIELQNDVMHDVVVHAYYTPKIDGLNAELVRDGSLGIEGRFNAGDRARLHNVFNRVLPAERHLPVVQMADTTDKRFQGLMITQFVLEDGWLGMAVGPTTSERVAERSRSLK